MTLTDPKDGDENGGFEFVCETARFFHYSPGQIAPMKFLSEPHWVPPIIKHALHQMFQMKDMGVDTDNKSNKGIGLQIMGIMTGLNY